MNASSLFDRIYPPERAARVAVVYEQRLITYEEMRVATVRAAGALHALGIVEGDRVAILLNDSPEFIASFVGVISIGAIAVPINMALRKDDQLFILKDCGARAAIVEVPAAETIFQSAGDGSDQAADAWRDLQQLLVVVRGEESARSSYAGISAQSFEHAPREPLSEEFPWRGNENAPAFILYTSGSTGEPKGAGHRQTDIFYTNETFCREVLGLREGDRIFSSSRLPFAYGLGNSFTFPLLNGFTTILCREKPAPEVIARVFQEYQPTIFFGVPVVYRMLLDYHRQAFRVPTSVGSLLSEKSPTEVGTLNTTSLRLCVSAGEALPAQLGEEWQRTFGVEVLDGIGSTEMLHMFMSNHQGDLRYGSSGKLLRGYEARLIDHDGVATQTGEIGNLWIRGGSAAIGYWQRPATTAETFVDNWVRTGDLYRCDQDGFWWHMGRSDDCFKPTGQWVSPVEVEGVLLRSEHVRAAAVVEGFDEHELSCVCAFIVLASDCGDAKTAEEELRALCEDGLPRFKQPRRYLFVPELPYTATGKVQRFKLREQLRSQRAAS
ncbi:MAG TPA: benzoate-CoA ligase family protein [Pyrinomonadaceae bacterium]|nr:benzoate-CoA ligase family protein [Pyrinomonadaceae bacterium]